MVIIIIGVLLLLLLLSTVAVYEVFNVCHRIDISTVQFDCRFPDRNISCLKKIIRFFLICLLCDSKCALSPNVCRSTEWN